MEQNWSARLRQGDEDALCEIIRQRTGYVSTILRNFSRSTLPPEDLEELSADVFLRLWRSRDKLKDGADLSPYLAAIARNCMKNYFRTQGKQPPVRQSYEDLLLSDKSDLCGDAETTEAIACLIRALDKLEEPDRSLVIRFYFYGEKTSALAKACGLTDTAVRLRLHRSRGKLRKYMIKGVLTSMNKNDGLHNIRRYS